MKTMKISYALLSLSFLLVLISCETSEIYDDPNRIPTITLNVGDAYPASADVSGFPYIKIGTLSLNVDVPIESLHVNVISGFPTDSISGAQFCYGLIALYPEGTTSSNMSLATPISGKILANTKYVLGVKYLPSTEIIGSRESLIFQVDLNGVIFSEAVELYFEDI